MLKIVNSVIDVISVIITYRFKLKRAKKNVISKFKLLFLKFYNQNLYMIIYCPLEIIQFSNIFYLAELVDMAQFHNCNIHSNHLDLV